MFRKLLGGAAIWFCAITAHAAPVHIVAAENFYGRIGERSMAELCTGYQHSQ